MNKDTTESMARRKGNLYPAVRQQNKLILLFSIKDVVRKHDMTEEQRQQIF